NILTRATGKTPTLISPMAALTPTSRAIPPRKAVPLPVGMVKKSDAKPIPPALTVGSTSARGTVLFVVLPRPHLALGTVADTIDPPLPPAKGTPRARTLALRQEPRRALAAAQSPPPAQSAPPTESVKKTPPIVRQVKNSQGIKQGTEQPLPPTPLPDSDMEIGDGSGLKGDYYQGRRFDLFQFTKADPNINFVFTDLPARSPSPKIPSGSDYTVRWTGKIAAKYSETYTLYATADDGVRVWINHHLIIDDWSAHAALEFSNRFTFKAGEQYPIKVEYLEIEGGAALVRLYWSSPSQPKQYIPEDAFFYPLPGDEEDLKRDKAPL
ncbi:MAG: PA14 domain-containing protein, partial [Armatimonadota bacterium]|nr:PA14 domain-containing protein [Armatimonadota bacterium]